MADPVAEVAPLAAREVAGQYAARHPVAHVPVAHVNHVPLGPEL